MRGTSQIAREEALRTVCSRCVLDTSAPDIQFDAAGVCNYCQDYETTRARALTGAAAAAELERRLERVRRAGKKQPYDCILGLSGGRDSCYLAYLAKQWGLRPLLVHFDNSWNSEVATRNIAAVVEKTGFDFFTYVVHWPEFRDLQLAYLKASVIDIEVPTDHLITATLFQLAARHGIQYFLSGNNVATEHNLPTGWSFRNKSDAVNLRAIHRQFGTLKLRHFPILSFLRRYWYTEVLQIQPLELLNLIDYRIADVEATLAREFGWVSPGEKHHESIYTRFYQSYILPRKFGVDKRKAHLSNLIWSGQLTRAEALQRVQQTPDTSSDYPFVLKKLGLSEIEFEKLLRAPVVPHTVFGTEADYRLGYRIFGRLARPFTFLLRLLYRGWASL